MQTNRVPDIYECSRVTFGVNCSPFLTQLVTQEHAKKFADEFPAAADNWVIEDCQHVHSKVVIKLRECVE